MNRRCAYLLASFVITTFSCHDSLAAGLAKSVAKAAIHRSMFAREAARDRATQAVALSKSKLVPRYTTKSQLQTDRKHGLAAGKHLVGPGEKKNLLTPRSAQQRFGLPRTPEVRQTWYLPKGTLVRPNKVWFGHPKASEITLVNPLPPKNLVRVEPLQSKRPH